MHHIKHKTPTGEQLADWYSTGKKKEMSFKQWVDSKMKKTAALQTKLLNSVASNVARRKGVLWKVQELGKKHNLAFLEKNPEVATSATAVGLGMLGHQLLKKN